MTRVIVGSLAEPGHVNPLLGAVQRLCQRGVEVGWCFMFHRNPDDGEMARRVRATGAELLTPPTFEPPSWVQELFEDLDRDKLRTHRGQLVQLGMQVAGHVLPGQVEGLRDVFAAYAPDAALLDPMLWHAGIASELEGVPYVSVDYGLQFALPAERQQDIDAWGFPEEQLAAYKKRRVALFAHYGVERQFAAHDPYSPWHNTVYCTEECIGPWARSSPPLTYLGAARWDDPAKPARSRHEAALAQIDAACSDGRPLIYAAYGTQVCWQPERLTLIAAAARRLGAHLVLAAGDLAADGDFIASLEGDPIVFERAPQLELLERCDAFVTHCGGNSVMEAFAAGVPMLADPVDLDQPIQAYFVDKSGVGRWLDLQQASLDDACEALDALLDPAGSARARAAAVKRSFDRHDGPAELADLVLSITR